MKYSIIVPVYNTEKYLSQCIDSVRNQTFSDWELWLIDDDSKDKSGEICDLYVTKDNRIHCIHKKNEGPLEARKNGIEHAKGEICLFLDSDDYWNKDLLRYVNEIFLNEKVDVVVFNMIHLYKNKQVKDSSLLRDDRRKLTGDIMISRMLEDTRLGSMSMKAVRYDKLMEVNQMIATDSCQGEDLYQSIALGLVCDRFYLLDKNLYYYRQRKSSSCHGNYSNRIEGHFSVRKKIECMLREYDMLDKDNLVCLKKSSLIYVAECIFNENNYNNTFQNKVNRLKKIKEWNEVNELLKYLPTCRVIFYQKLRMILFDNSFFAFLILIDKFLMLGKIILQKIRKKEMFV